MPTSDHELKKIAALAYLELDLSHSTQLKQDLNAMMNFVDQLRQVDTSNISPLFHPLDLDQRLRKDEITEMNHEIPLSKMAPLFADGLFLVPKVIDTGK